MTLLKNSDGKILRNSGGKTLKQNYNLGMAFRGGNIDNAYGRVNTTSLPAFNSQGFTVQWIFDTNGANGSGGIVNIESASGWIGTDSASNATGSDFFDLDFSTGDRMGDNNVFFDKTSATILFADVGTKKYSKASLVSEDIFVAAMLGEVATLIEINALMKASGSGGRGNYQYAEFRLYNRIISNNELKYWYNNGLYNSPLVMTDLLCWYDFSLAQILDFSALQDGSDMRVGVRNLGTIIDAHLELFNLPAGTNEEKRDYANQNLFTSFI